MRSNKWVFNWSYRVHWQDVEQEIGPADPLLWTEAPRSKEATCADLCMPHKVCTSFPTYFAILESSEPPWSSLWNCQLSYLSAIGDRLSHLVTSIYRGKKHTPVSDNAIQVQKMDRIASIVESDLTVYTDHARMNLLSSRTLAYLIRLHELQTGEILT